MKRVNLVKYGFVRWPEEDFSDDGSMFYCYKVGKRVRVSKCTYNGEVYLSGHIDGNKIDYKTYMVLPHYKAMDRLNGVSIEGLTEADLEQFYEDCLAYEKEYEEAESKVVYPTLEALKKRNDEIVYKRQMELAIVKGLFDDHGYDIIMKAGKYELESIKNYTKSLEAKTVGYTDEWLAEHRESSFSTNFVSPECSELKESYYFRWIKEVLDRVLAA